MALHYHSLTLLVAASAAAALAGCAAPAPPPGVSVLSTADGAAKLILLAPRGRHDAYQLLYRGRCEKVPIVGTGIAGAMAENIFLERTGNIRPALVKPLEPLTIGFTCQLSQGSYCHVAGSTMLQPGKSYIVKGECGYRCTLGLHESETGAPVPLLPPLAHQQGVACVVGQVGD